MKTDKSKQNKRNKKDKIFFLSELICANLWLEKMFSRLCLFLISAVSFVLSGCNNSGNQSALNPAGEQAGHLNDLWWIFFGICAFVYVAVMIFLLVALFKNRRKQNVGEIEPPDAHPDSAARKAKRQYRQRLSCRDDYHNVHADDSRVFAPDISLRLIPRRSRF